MSRPHKQRNESLDILEKQDETTRRRLRNRLSQRNFRERKSIYIKELEKRSKLNAVSESERNRILLNEARDLRAQMLQLRSKFLKLSVSLSAIGLQIGNILDIDQPSGQWMRRLAICSDFVDGLAPDLTNSVEDEESSAQETFGQKMGSQGEDTNSTDASNPSICTQIQQGSPKQAHGRSIDIDWAMSESTDVDSFSHQETAASNEDVTMGLLSEDRRCSNRGFMEFFELLQQGDAQVQLIGLAIPEDFGKEIGY